MISSCHTLAGYNDRMEMLQFALTAILAVACILQFLQLRRSRRRDGAAVEASLVGISARLDEQGRRQTDQAQALRAGLDRRLDTSFDRSARALSDISSRLALIDRAQQGVQDLATQVVSLRQILSDRSARGAFGEVQLEALLADVLPTRSYRMQCKLSNRRIADCVLSLPPPTGKIAIDSKFPLENYQLMIDKQPGSKDRENASKAFAGNVKQHINDVANRYIVPGETCDSAVLFLPSEAVFAEIHGAHPSLVELAHRRRVLLTSPTTLVAVLTTAASLLKDAAVQDRTRELKGQLRELASDFNRFEERIDKLATHTRLAREDARRAKISAGKLITRFREIDEMEV